MSVPEARMTQSEWARTAGVWVAVRTAPLTHPSRPPVPSGPSPDVWPVPKGPASLLIVAVVCQILLTAACARYLQAGPAVKPRDTLSPATLHHVSPMTQAVVCRLAVSPMTQAVVCRQAVSQMTQAVVCRLAVSPMTQAVVC